MSPTTSPKQSDSQGDTAGDRSGGGEEGGGQKAEQTGTGTPGTHTTAEQGGSASDQQGEGPTGSKAGEQVKADRPTGQPGADQQGPGSTAGKQPGGPPSSASRQEQQPASSPGQSGTSAQAGGQTPERLDPEAEGQPGSGPAVTGGAPGEAPPEAPPSDRGTLGGEDPNLEYARRQTELVLEFLEDQLAKNEPDRELLDRLGWTRDDLREFARRWQDMRRAAGRQGLDGENSRTELDDTLRSLGLRPRATEIRGGGPQKHDVQRLRDSRRFDPPAEWAEQFRAYTRSLQGSGQGNGD